MSGYGIDQMVLRAEILAPEVKPAAIIMSFIADDVRRTEMKRVWGAEKPYFELVDGALVERNVPVPLPPDSEPDARYLAASCSAARCCFDTVLHAARLALRMVHRRRARAAAPRGRASSSVRCSSGWRRSACRCWWSPSTIPYHWLDDGYRSVTRHTDDAVLACATAAGLATLDLFDTIDEAVRTRGLRTIYRQHHPAPAGTEITARRIAAELQKRHIPPRRSSARTSQALPPRFGGGGAVIRRRRGNDAPSRVTPPPSA